ncbi:unnamed protein product [Sphacelaria rigidula]
MVSAHDLRCLAAIDIGHKERYYTRWLKESSDPPNTLAVDYLRVARPGNSPYTNQIASVLSEDEYVRPSIINEAIAVDLSCARDHKWWLVAAAIDRQECDCVNQVHVIVAVYRLWKCTGGDLDDLGIASIYEEYNGGRDFWFERIHLTSTVCEFPEDSRDGVALNLTSGAVPYDPYVHAVSQTPAGALSLNTSSGLGVQLTWKVARNYTSYADLKDEVWVLYY